MKIKFSLYRTDEWLKAKAIAVGENLPNMVIVEVDSKSLSVDERTWLVNYYGGKLPEELPLIRFNGEYEARNNSYYGSTFMYSHEDNPTEEDAIGALANCIANIASKREEYQVKRSIELERERIANEEKAARDKAYADARELLKDELEELKRLKEYREVLSDVLTECTYSELVDACEEADVTWKSLAEASAYTLPSPDEE